MAAPCSVNVGPDEARGLAEHGGTLLLLGVPDGTSFGMDQQMFVTGPRFQGVKMLPPGPHFVYYSAAGKHGGQAPIVGFFVVLKQGQVVVRQWDGPEERLAPLTDEEQVERLAGGVRSFQFDAGLGAYDLHKYAAWQTLSNFITEEVVRAHEPVGGDICVVCEADVSESRPKTGAERALQEQIRRGREHGQPGGTHSLSEKTETIHSREGAAAGQRNASERKGKGLADVTQGVIIMDQGEEREAAAETLVERTELGSSKTVVTEKSEEVAAKGDGAAMSCVDQIALLYQRREMNEGGSEGSRQGANGAEAMDVDTRGGANVEDHAVSTSQEQVRGGALTQLERHDFAGLRGSAGSSGLVETSSGYQRPTIERTDQGSIAGDGKRSVEKPPSGESTGGMETREEPKPSGSGRTPQASSGRCFYTELPRLVKRKGMSPAELTALNLDKSGLLESVLSKQYRGREERLLGEMQFAFIAFVMGQSLESFAQWKAILHLMLGCVDAPLRTHTRLFVQFLRALYWQLRHGLLPTSERGSGDALLDEAWLTKDSFLQHLLAAFFSTLREAQPIDGELKQQAEALQTLLEGSLGWRLGGAEEGSLDDDDDDEYAPTVVY